MIKSKIMCNNLVQKIRNVETNRSSLRLPTCTNIMNNVEGFGKGFTIVSKSTSAKTTSGPSGSSKKSGTGGKVTSGGGASPKKPTCSGPSLYECRKYGHMLPQSTTQTPFEMLQNFPTGIFRDTSGEKLGPCAAKDAVYKNPEYFSFQHMTYFDMHLLLRCFRMPPPNPNRKS